MKTLGSLFDKNKQWAGEVKNSDPGFFDRLSKQQNPRYLWIGCSDSRVPANQIIGLDPGEVFVHRNVGNLVIHTDINCLSVIQYAVDVLKIQDIIVCGHYGCGAVNNAIEGPSLGLIDNWILNIKEIYKKNKLELSKAESGEHLANRLCELNIIQQVKNVCHTSIVQSAWSRGQRLNVHGWIYSLKDGLLKDLNVTIESVHMIDQIFRVLD